MILNLIDYVNNLWAPFPDAMTLLVVGTSAGIKWLVDDGGDVGHHRPSVVSQRGVTGGPM